MPSFTKSIGFDVALGMDPANGITFTTLGHVIDGFKGQTAKADFADTTFLSDKYKTFLPASVDPGELSFSIGYDPQDVGAGSTYGLLCTALNSGTIASFQFQLTYPGGAVPTGGGEVIHAFVAEVGREIEKNKLNQCPVKLRLSGDPAMGGN